MNENYPVTHSNLYFSWFYIFTELYIVICIVWQCIVVCITKSLTIPSPVCVRVCVCVCVCVCLSDLSCLSKEISPDDFVFLLHTFCHQSFGLLWRLIRWLFKWATRSFITEHTDRDHTGLYESKDCYTCEDTHWHNVLAPYPNLHLNLILTLKPSLNPQKAFKGRNVLTVQKVSSLPWSKTQMTKNWFSQR